MKGRFLLSNLYSIFVVFMVWIAAFSVSIFVVVGVEMFYDWML